MPLFPPQDYRKTEFTHRRGLAADRPAAADVLVGTLYFSTDTLTLERSTGVIWQTYAPSGAAGATGSPGPPGLDAESEDQYFIFQGPKGDIGSTGATGATGNLGPPGLAGEDADQNYNLIPGPKGELGASGITGFILVEADEPEAPLMVPGPKGDTGAAGSSGTNGFMVVEADEPDLPLMIQGPQGATGPSGSSTLTNFTKDLGVANYSGTFDITGLAGLTVDKNVLIVQTMQKITSKGDARDEFEMQPIILTGYVFDSATIRALWNCDSICVGTYAFAYAVSG